MSAARTLSLLSLLFLVSGCGVMGAPIAYVDAYPDPPPPPAAVAPPPAVAEPATAPKPAKEKPKK